MKKINEYIFEELIYRNILNEEYDIITNNIIMLNESFKSTLLQKVAKRIYDVEWKNRELDKTNKSYGYGKNEKTFSSIFGPITVTKRYSNEKNRLQGIKWDEITDEQFIKLEGGQSKEIKKIVEPFFSRKEDGLVILTNPGTQDIIYVLKGYGQKPDSGHNYTPHLYQFVEPTKNSWGGYNRNGVKTVTKPKYKYDTRDLKFNEFLEVCKSYDLYILPFSESMIKDYKDLVQNRKDLQSGVINYDAESLKRLLDQQKARYNAIVKERKANKLIQNSDKLFEEIEKINQEVIDLYKLIISKPEYLTKYIDLGSLMTYVSYAYENYYKYCKSDFDAMQQYQKFKAKGHSKEDAEKYVQFERERGKEHIRDVRDYLNRIKENIKKIKDNL